MQLVVCGVSVRSKKPQIVCNLVIQGGQECWHLDMFPPKAHPLVVEMGFTPCPRFQVRRVVDPSNLTSKTRFGIQLLEEVRNVQEFPAIHLGIVSTGPFHSGMTKIRSRL